MDEGHLVSAADLRRIERLLLAYEKGELNPIPTSPPRQQPPGRPDILVMLLDTCNGGDRVQAAILEEVSTNETQIVTAYGQPTSGYFRLGFTPPETSTVQWTARIDAIADDADAIRAKFEALEAISPGDVSVSGGLVTTPDDTEHNPNRWLITFGGKYAGIDIPLLQIDDHVDDAELEVDSYYMAEDSGRVEWVREVIGVGVPTPIRAGARAIAHWIHGFGYCLGPIEARDYGDYGLVQ